MFIILLENNIEVKGSSITITQQLAGEEMNYLLFSITFLFGERVRITNPMPTPHVNKRKTTNSTQNFCNHNADTRHELVQGRGKGGECERGEDELQFEYEYRTYNLQPSWMRTVGHRTNGTVGHIQSYSGFR